MGELRLVIFKVKIMFVIISEINNVMVIGMTNRRELMDLALLRPGR